MSLIFMIDHVSYFLIFFGGFMAWIGPTFFFAFRSANNDSFRMRPVDYLHFAFGVILVLVPIWSISIDTATKVFSPGRFYNGKEEHQFI